MSAVSNDEELASLRPSISKRPSRETQQEDDIDVIMGNNESANGSGNLGSGLANNI